MSASKDIQPYVTSMMSMYDSNLSTEWYEWGDPPVKNPNRNDISKPEYQFDHLHWQSGACKQMFQPFIKPKGTVRSSGCQFTPGIITASDQETKNSSTKTMDDYKCIVEEMIVDVNSSASRNLTQRVFSENDLDMLEFIIEKMIKDLDVCKIGKSKIQRSKIDRKQANLKYLLHTSIPCKPAQSNEVKKHPVKQLFSSLRQGILGLKASKTRKNKSQQNISHSKSEKSALKQLLLKLNVNFSNKNDLKTKKKKQNVSDVDRSSKNYQCMYFCETNVKESFEKALATFYCTNPLVLEIEKQICENALQQLEDLGVYVKHDLVSFY